MSRSLVTLKADIDQIRTIEGLADVFEGIASIKIAKIRNKVVTSKAFFVKLWGTYLQLRLDADDQHHGRRTNKKTAFVAVTSEARLSGASVSHVVTALAAARAEQPKADVIVLGKQGGVACKQRNIAVTQLFSLPESDEQFGVIDVVSAIQDYERIVVFYETYESLRTQRTQQIELVAAVRELRQEATELVGDAAQNPDEVMTSASYIFEPSLKEIASYLESLMMEVALTQVIMESKLSQYASRFNAMSAAKNRAAERVSLLDRQYYRAKRATADERLKEAAKALLTATEEVPV